MLGVFFAGLVIALAMSGWSSRNHKAVKYKKKSAAHVREKPRLPKGVCIPSGQTSDFVRSYDDSLWLFERRWLPTVPADSPLVDLSLRAALIVVHGTVDHSGVYDELGSVLTDSRVALYAADMRGWGLSDGQSLYFHDVDVFVRDVMQTYARVRAEVPTDVPIFIAGKSLGGLVAAFAVLKHPRSFAGLLGIAGGFQIDPGVVPSRAVVSLLRLAARVVPKAPFRRPFDPKLIVSDAQALEEWKRDPLVSRGRLRLGYGVEILRCTDELKRRVGEINVAMLMMIGSEDKVVTREGHQMMVTRSASSDTTLKVYPGGYHNLLQEPALKDQVARDIASWIVETSSKI